jgi:RNA polymerase sigma-70 factor (ECF subfamily)
VKRASATRERPGADVALRAALAPVYAQQERFLWGLCYRLTGSAADADDLVQQTFVRALESPPARTDEPWRPWLTRVAVNLGRDLLRRRKRRGYVGPWLPSPVEIDETTLASYEPRLVEGVTTEGRYDLLESVSMAFLVALEALTPKQRAVLLLRDVFDYTVSETADALGVSEPDVKTTHHRARRAMDAYDRKRCRPTRELQDETRTAVATLMTALTTGDSETAERMLAASVTALSDGGGEFFAARVPVVGRERVLKFYGKVASQRGDLASSRVALVNGLPALITEFGHDLPRQASRLVTCFTIDGSGRIDRIYSVLATAKLTAIRFDP